MDHSAVLAAVAQNDLRWALPKGLCASLTKDDAAGVAQSAALAQGWRQSLHRLVRLAARHPKSPAKLA
ncbi:MAG: hypothetical protein V4753_14165 [Pseudomonadota bacterium]